MRPVHNSNIWLSMQQTQGHRLHDVRTLHAATCAQLSRARPNVCAVMGGGRSFAITLSSREPGPNALCLAFSAAAPAGPRYVALRAFKPACQRSAGHPITMSRHRRAPPAHNMLRNEAAADRPGCAWPGCCIHACEVQRSGCAHACPYCIAAYCRLCHYS